MPSCPASRDGTAFYNYPGTVAFPLQRAHPGSAGPAGANGRTSSTSGTTSPRTKGVHCPRRIAQAYTKAYSPPGRMRAGWAYFVSFPKGARDFERALPDQADDAGARHRGRQSRRNRAGSANGDRRAQGDGRVAEGHRSLGDGRAPEGDDGRADQVLVRRLRSRYRDRRQAREAPHADEYLWRDLPAATDVEIETRGGWRWQT